MKMEYLNLINAVAIKHAFNVSGNVPILIYEQKFEINFKINLRIQNQREYENK